MKANIVLYVDSNHASPYALSAYATLMEKGLLFDMVETDLGAGAHHTQDYTRLSITARVPTLVHGDFSLSESSAIVEYLEEAFPPPQFPCALPQDIQQRAMARQIQAWIRSDMAALRSERPTWIFHGERRPAPLSPQAQHDADKLLAAAGRLIDNEGNPLFGAWCIADTDLAVMLNRLIANGDSVPDKIRRYVHRQWERASMADWWQIGQR